MIIDRESLDSPRLTFVIAILPLPLLLLSEFWQAIGRDSYIRIFREDGPVEYAQFLFLLTASVLGFIISRTTRAMDHRSLSWLYLLASLCIMVWSMEEISWGQRIFGITTPEFFHENNFQREINLHNLDTIGLDGEYSFWFDISVAAVVLYISFAWLILPAHLFAARPLLHLIVPGWYLGSYFLLPTLWMSCAECQGLAGAPLPHKHENAELMISVGCLIFMMLGVLRLGKVEPGSRARQ